MEENFKDKRALVTGAGKGIGRATAKALVRCGADVIALSRTQSDLDSLKAECPSISTVCMDVTDIDGVRKLVENSDVIHLLVNNAGVAMLRPFLEATPEDFDVSFSINTKAAMFLSQAVARKLVASECAGSIVNVSSQASMMALQDHTIYCASKAAMDQMTKAMALELGKHKIRVNCVNPTVVLTDMGRLGWSNPAKAGPMLATIPLGRFAEETEVVNAILFLLSDKASMIHGTLLPVDGGRLVH